MTRKKDYDLKALEKARDALTNSTSRKMLKANLEFLWDYFIRNPSKELPPHLSTRGKM